MKQVTKRKTSTPSAELGTGGRGRVDCHAVLEKLLDLRILTWRYKHEPRSVRHIGPIAEEFAAAFRVGANDRTITISDAVGVAYASIRALHELLEQRRREIAALRREIERRRRIS